MQSCPVAIFLIAPLALTIVLVAWRLNAAAAARHERTERIVSAILGSLLADET